MKEEDKLTILLLSVCKSANQGTQSLECPDMPFHQVRAVSVPRTRPEEVDFELGTLSEGTMHGIATEQSKSTVRMQCLPLFRFYNVILH